MAKIEVSSLQGWIPLEYKPNPRANHIGRKASVTPQYPRSPCRKRRTGWSMPRVKSVFELMDPDGHIYVLQAYDGQFPIESLAKLGEQMKQLPVLQRTSNT